MLFRLLPRIIIDQFKAKTMNPVDHLQFIRLLNNLNNPLPPPCRVSILMLFAPWTRIGTNPFNRTTFYDNSPIVLRIQFNSFRGEYEHRDLDVLLEGYVCAANEAPLQRFYESRTLLCPGGRMVHDTTHEAVIPVPSNLPESYFSPRGSITYVIYLEEREERIIAWRHIQFIQRHIVSYLLHPLGFPIQLQISQRSFSIGGDIRFSLGFQPFQVLGMIKFVLIQRETIGLSRFVRVYTLGSALTAAMRGVIPAFVPLQPFQLEPSQTVANTFQLAYTLQLRGYFGGVWIRAPEIEIFLTRN